MRISENLQAATTLRDIPGGRVDMISFNSPGQVVEWLRTAGALSGVSFASAYDWFGLGKQSTSDFIATARPDAMLEHFNKSQAKLHADLIIGGRPRPTIAGGTWVIPEFLAGNPLCARSKKRAVLPPKTFHFILQPSASVKSTTLANLGATIARALWDYSLSGGGVTLRISYLYGYSAPTPQGAEALYYDVKIPLTSDSALALAFSPVFERGLGVDTATRFFKAGGCPVKMHLHPTGGVILTGRASDVETLAKLGIVYKYTSGDAA